MRMRSTRPIVQGIMIATMCVTALSPRAAAQSTAQTAPTKAAPPATPQKASPPPARPAAVVKAMTNTDVVKMVQGGLGDDLILIAIRKAPRTAFDLSADGLLDLKGKGVSSTILRLMLDPTAKVEAAPAPVATAAAPPAVAKPVAPPPPPSTPPASASTSEAAKPASVPGGATLTAAKAYDAAYDAVVNYLKKQGQGIDSASKDTGRIVTALTITGGRTQTGRSIQITLMKDAANSTTVRVAIMVQTRQQNGPWDDPKVDPKQSQLAADELKGVLGAAQ